MAIRIIKIEDTPAGLAALIRRMYERDECILIKDGEDSVAYLNLAYRPDLWGRAPGIPADAPPQPAKPVPQISCTAEEISAE
jgi:hypothetical protein